MNNLSPPYLQAFLLRGFAYSQMIFALVAFPVAPNMHLTRVVDTVSHWRGLDCFFAEFSLQMALKCICPFPKKNHENVSSATECAGMSMKRPRLVRVYTCSCCGDNSRLVFPLAVCIDLCEEQSSVN